MGNWIGKEWLQHENEKIVDTSKVVAADFDPRSPSSGILR